MILIIITIPYNYCFFLYLKIARKSRDGFDYFRIIQQMRLVSNVPQFYHNGRQRCLMEKVRNVSIIGLQATTETELRSEGKVIEC